MPRRADFQADESHPNQKRRKLGQGGWAQPWKANRQAFENWPFDIYI